MRFKVHWKLHLLGQPPPAFEQGDALGDAPWTDIGLDIQVMNPEFHAKFKGRF